MTVNSKFTENHNKMLPFMTFVSDYEYNMAGTLQTLIW